MTNLIRLLIWKIHIQWLLGKYRVTVVHTSWWSDSSINVSDRKAWLPMVSGPVSYITCLHELGHLRTVGLWSDVKYVQNCYGLRHFLTSPSAELETIALVELLANEWAIKHALFFCPEMGRTIRYSYHSYEKILKEHPLYYKPTNWMSDHFFTPTFILKWMELNHDTYSQ